MATPSGIWSVLGEAPFAGELGIGDGERPAVGVEWLEGLGVAVMPDWFRVSWMASSDSSLESL
jgi:hypothetical protein